MIPGWNGSLNSTYFLNLFFAEVLVAEVLGMGGGGGGGGGSGVDFNAALAKAPGVTPWVAFGVSTELETEALTADAVVAVKATSGPFLSRLLIRFRATSGLAVLAI